MKKLTRILSYLATAMLACAVTLYLCTGAIPVGSKLDQLQQLIETRFIGEADMEKAEDAAAKAMVAALGDRWSYYLSAQEFAAHMEQTENAYVGVGITISEDEAGEGFLVIEVQPGSSAQEAGLLPGDLVVAAQGQSVLGLSIAELRDLIRGPEGTTVSMEIKREGQTLSLSVERRKVLTPVVASQLLEGDIGLIAISNFDSRCAQESIQAIESLREQGATALIFDVRNNPGGYATELVELLDYLLPEGVLFRTLDYTGRESADYSDAAYLDMPIAVVCNENSYSAAEFFPAAIQEYEAGVIVGTPTYGKGYFQFTYQFQDGSGVGLSVGKYFTPQGRSLAEVGIQPDILVEVDEETSYAIYLGALEPQEDPQLMAAVNALKNR